MKLSHIYFFFVFFSQLNTLFSQTPPYYHYSSTDGLASSTVFDILQDRNGYLWFATSNGISRFDGHRFKNYGIKEGLNSNVITSIIEGSEGEIYIANYEKGINILKDGNIENYTKKSVQDNFINYIFLEQNILFGYGYQKLYKCKIDKIETILNYTARKDLNNKQIVFNRFCKISDGTFIASTSDGFYKVVNNDFEKIKVEGFPDTDIYCTVETKNGNLIAGSKGKIYIIKNYKVVKVLKTNYPDGKVTAIINDSRGNIWFSIINMGFYVIREGSDEIYDIGIKLKLQKTVVNDFCEDNEGNIWVSTMGKGVFCLNNLFVNNYNDEDGLSSNSVQAIEKDENGRIILGTLNGISILEDGKFGMLEIRGNSFLTDYIYEMKSINNKVYVCSSFPNYKIINRFYKNTEFVLLPAISFGITQDTNYLIGNFGGYIHTYKNISSNINLSEDSKFSVFGAELINNRVNEIFEDSERNLWLGTSLGLCRIKNGEKKYFPESEVLNSPIKAIIQDHNNKVWFAGDKGISYFSKKDSVISSYKNIPGYDFSSSTSLAIDKYGRIWVGNMKGLYILNNNSIKYINNAQGLPSNEVLSLFYDNEKNVMWIGTSSGLSSFDINLYDSYKPPSINILIDNIKAGDSVYIKFDSLVFEPGNNNIHIGYSTFNYSSPSNLKYQYKLKNEWINTDYDFLDFESMNEGLYGISFRAKTQNGEWSQPSFVSFIIKPKFIETTFFYVLIIVFFAGVILFTTKHRINLQRKKNSAKLENAKKIHELEHQALSAMMNPHFIFNSLNSVQYLVNKGRNDEANDYISILAKLIRKNLDTAGNSFINLDEEISRLTLYLQIEKLRFQDKFSYEINTGDEIDIDSVMIPNMILQPFVENSVWYGIMNVGKKGFVKISFSFETINIEANIHRCLVIKITDNGIGLKKSAERNKEDHISKGIKIIQERLQLLSKELELPTPIIIEDLSLRNENSTGTEVIITLPQSLYRNTSEDSV